MNMKKSIYILAISMCMTSTISGCGTLFNNNKGIVATEPTEITVTPGAPEEKIAESQIKLSKKLLNGEWIIYKVYGKKVNSGDERPYINFSVAENRFYGSNGCNIINGDFIVEQGDEISLSNIITTQRYCADAEYETEINKAINEVKSYSIEQRGNEYYLTLHDENNSKIMTLRKHNMDFLNGAWRVISISDKKCDDESVQLLIDIPELKIHGNTGCNILNGTLYIDPDKENAIQFQQIITTRMACDKQKHETAFLIALEEVDVCRRGKDNTAIMYDNDNNVVLVLKKIDDK